VLVDELLLALGRPAERLVDLGFAEELFQLGEVGGGEDGRGCERGYPVDLGLVLLGCVDEVGGVAVVGLEPLLGRLVVLVVADVDPFAGCVAVGGRNFPLVRVESVVVLVVVLLGLPVLGRFLQLPFPLLLLVLLEQLVTLDAALFLLSKLPLLDLS
jgi:hypothetical protein